ncbi:MAG: hypothetical protein LUI10_10140 [Lachnospiraceae bacterium]|nr:hypothetical protein [Lachnospiraceae bacterium]
MMTKRLKREQAEQWLIPTVITAVVIAFIGCRYGFWFAYNDDVTMNAILSGVYSGNPDIHCVYMSPILSALFAGLYGLVPAVPWYGLFLGGSQFWVLWLCLRGICRRASETWIRIAGSTSFALLFCALLLYWLVFLQYTMTAAILADGAVFLVLLDQQESEGKIRWKTLVLPLVLFTLSGLLRNNVGLMHLIFLGIVCAYQIFRSKGRKAGRTEYCLLGAAALLVIAGAAFYQEYIPEIWTVSILLAVLWAAVWLVRNFRNQKKRILKYGLFFAAAAVLTLSGRKLTGLIYVSDTWEEYTTFNVYRTDIYDFYGVPDYWENTELYESLGLTLEDYYALLLYDYGFSDNIDAYVMQTLAEYAAPERVSFMDDVREILITVVNRFQEDPVEPDDNLMILAFAVTVLACILAKDPMTILQLQFLYDGYVICWFYLYWVDRVMEHVYHGISLAVVMILAGICMEQLKTISRKSHGEILCGILLAFGLVYLGNHMSRSLSDFEDQYAAHMENSKIWDAYREYCLGNPENLYFTDTGSLTGTGPENIFDVHRTEMENYVLAGGWMANSPLYEEKLEYYGIEGSFTSALESGGTLYYICSSDQSVQWISYYICPADISVTIQRMDGIYVDGEEVLTVYAVYRNDLP